MTIFIRIWLAFTIVLCIGGFLFFTNLEKHVKPTAQQVVEDTLIDSTQILASIASPILSDVYQHNLNATNKPLGRQQKKLQEFSKQIDQAFSLPINAKVWRNHKKDLDFHIYITDDKGIVIYDSQHQALGADYSRWNDVYKTLKGQYGARASQIKPNDPSSSVMYIAAPIYLNQTVASQTSKTNPIIGVLTIGKPSASLLPYLDNTYTQMINVALWVGLSSMILAGLVAMWIRRSIFLVNRYTQSLAQDVNKPKFYLASELNQLSNSIAKMREDLENKAYVTQYVHTLTHELKSPITAIQASSELMMDELPIEDREQFGNNILHQCQKLKTLVDQMLLLAKLEQPNFKLNLIQINLANFIDELITQNQSKIKLQDINFEILVDSDICIKADKFWFEHAVQNLLENAIHFCDEKIIIRSDKEQGSAKTIALSIFNTGKHVEDYALPKLFDRYFSVPKSTQSKKGTGIGLTLVKEVVEKHHWSVDIKNDYSNQQKGVKATINNIRIYNDY